MPELLHPTIDTITNTVTQVGPFSYEEQIANPLIEKYSRREFGDEQDQEVSFAIQSLSPHFLDIKDISEKHIPRVGTQIMMLGAGMVEHDIKTGRWDDEIQKDRSRTGFWLFSTMAWLEVTRRRHNGAINSTALFRATEEIFREKFGDIFVERPLAERLKMFNDGYKQAWEMVHEGGFTVIGGK